MRIIVRTNANARSPFTFTFAFTRAGSALERRLERPRTPQRRDLHVRIKAPTGAMERTGVIFEVNYSRQRGHFRGELFTPKGCGAQVEGGVHTSMVAVEV